MHAVGDQRQDVGKHCSETGTRSAGRRSACGFNLRTNLDQPPRRLARTHRRVPPLKRPAAQTVMARRQEATVRTARSCSGFARTWAAAKISRAPIGAQSKHLGRSIRHEITSPRVGAGIGALDRDRVLGPPWLQRYKVMTPNDVNGVGPASIPKGAQRVVFTEIRPGWSVERG